MKATSRIATTLSRSGADRDQRRAAVARDASLTSYGSGAPSPGPRRIALLVLAASFLVAAILAPSAFASKTIVDEFNGNEPGFTHGVAVNSSGVGPANPGDVYFADEKNRIQRFDAAGNFISAWGANAIHRTEVQRITPVAEGGTFTLTFEGQTTVPIAYNPHGFLAGAVQTALRNLSTIGSPNVTVSQNNAGEPINVSFVGALEGTDVPQLTADPNALQGSPPEVHIETLTDGSGGGGTNYEICTVASACGPGVASGGNGTVAGDGNLNSPQAVAVDEDTGNVYVSDVNNHRIDEYDGEGNFIRAFGFDVDATTAPTTYEVCPATDVCKAGLGGSGVGQVSSSGAAGIAVSQPDGNPVTGTVFLADLENRRIETYALDGSSPASIGSAAVFGAGASGFEALQPRSVAVDSRGIVYASNVTEGGEIERYDSQNANGGGTVFLAPIPAAVNETQTIHFSGFANTGNDYYTLTCPNGEATEQIRYGEGLTFTQNALEAKCGAGNFSFSGSGEDITITFQGAYAGINVPPMTCTTVHGGTCSVSAETVPHTGALPATNFPGTATAGLAVDPDTDGAGSDTDTLYVLRRPTSGSAIVQQFGPVNKPGLTAPPTAVDEVHGAAASSVLGFSPAGIGVNYLSGRLFVSSRFIYVLADPASLSPPVFGIEPIIVKGETTATFSGFVNPAGARVSCVFQYSTDQANWTDVPEPDCAALASGGGYQTISQEVTGLDPNTHYYVRLAVSRPYVSNSTVFSAVRAFDTDSAPPVVTDPGAVQVSNTSARLVGTIDPRHSATGYVFEYGTTPSLGSSTAPLDVGAGAKPITVSQVVNGLNPDTTYFLKLVATNAFGTTPSVTATFHTRTEPLPLPDDRRYEMVTPPDKNLSDAQNGPFAAYVAGASRDGQSVAFCASPFGEPAVQAPFECASYMSRRGSTGWNTNSPVPRICRYDLSGAGNSGETHAYLSPNFDSAVASIPQNRLCSIPPIDENSGEQAFYREDFATEPPAYQLMPGNYAGGSDDFSHVILQQGTGLYDWEQQGHGSCVQAGGCSTLISKEPGGSPFATQSNIAGLHFGEAVSADGDRVYFDNPTSSGGCSSASCQLYMREDDATTYAVSASECTSSCGAEQAAFFTWANPDGGTALFYSCAKLTDASAAAASCNPYTPYQISGTPSGASGHKLYRWQQDAAPGHHLVDLTVDHEPNDGTQPNYQGLLGASDDGNTVYFVANGQIVSGQPTGGGAKIYRWRWNGGVPVVDYLGSFAQLVGSSEGAGSQRLDGALNYDDHYRNLQVSPDGRYLVISTTVRLDRAADSDSDADIYRWDEEDGWVCVSCQLPGVPSAGDANMAAHFHGGAPLSFGKPLTSEERPVTFSADGQRIFFQTPDALVPADVNGEAGCPALFGNGDTTVYACEDVYEWHDGTVSLVSSGTSSQNAWLIGTDPSGNDVFFFTDSRLVGWDLDNNVDIYDARVGGGFPEPPAQPAECEGEACRGQGSAPLAVPGAGTHVFEGPGNQPKSLTPKPCRRGFVRRNGKCVKQKPHSKKKQGNKRGARR